MSLCAILNLAALVVLPFWLHGVVNRVKSWWAGRRGPPVFQLAFDVRRLLRKGIVVGDVTTPIFRIGPYAYLASALGAALLAPIAGVAPLVSFPLDFVWLAYLWGLGRMALALAALDTGSSFEGMGAAREMTFSCLLEPALLLALGALAVTSRALTLHDLLTPGLPGAIAAIALFVALQVEAGRLPVDDPNTHLELTMVHEVMVLDHGGAELAAIQLGTALKLLVGTALIARLMSPWARATSGWAVSGHLLASTLIAVLIGTIESLIARLRLRTVPAYIAVAVACATVSLALAATLRGLRP